MTPESILRVWRQFDSFPMETLTKAWHLRRNASFRQRTVDELVEHRTRTGASGNCFDLALWLLHAFERESVPAYAVGDGVGTTDAHVAIVALDSERRYLCDLGDLWILPLPIDEEGERQREGLFAGAVVSSKLNGQSLDVEYRRHNGKSSTQRYDLRPLAVDELIEGGNLLQQTLSPPLVEMRIWEPGEIVHWEFEDGASFISRSAGLEREVACATLDEWAARISFRTKMKESYVLECLEASRELLSSS